MSFQVSRARKNMTALLVAFLLLVSAACSREETPEELNPVVSGADEVPELRGLYVEILPVFKELEASGMVALLFPPGDADKAVVVERAGLLKVISRADHGKSSSTWLDIRKKLRAESLEDGLLGIALHPAFAENGLFYVLYTARGPGKLVLARFHAEVGLSSEVSSETEAVILELPQPFGNHNGGGIAFGADGYLYLGLGDGGAGGDPRGNGQNPSSWLGSILRLDVDNPSENMGYSIPKGNPFASGEKGAPEVYAYGFRDPKFLAFDEKGRLWASDTSQRVGDEINQVTRGSNYGWRRMEGERCYQGRRCTREGLELPFATYRCDHSGHIIGGGVFDGKGMPELKEHFIFGDSASGEIAAISLDSRPAIPVPLVKTHAKLTAFARDLEGRLYLVGRDGTIGMLSTD